jgi:heavy metal sensor kinase
MAARRLTRGLRFKLTVSFGLFFALTLVSIGVIFRGELVSTVNAQISDGLTQDWDSVKGYLKIQKTRDGTYERYWFADYEDADEAWTVSRLRSVIAIADENGRFMELSPKYESIGQPSRAAIQSTLSSRDAVLREVRSQDGIPYMVRSWYVYDEYHSRKFFVSIGRPLTNSRKLLQQFTWVCWGVIPLAIVGGSLLGWIVAGRALTPVLEVARTAQRISGSNLSMRIPVRGAGDELDYLIQTFNRMIERLDSSFTQMRRFSIDVSHELRTPITIIRGQLEVALFTAQTTEQYRDAIVSSLQDIERLSQIVRALLLLSQAETGQVVLQKTPLDLAAVVKDITEQFEIPAEGAQVSLAAHGADEPVWIDADRVQIERMLSNLLSNAMKFTPAGGDVRVKLTRVDANVQLEVEDTGVGIPPDHLPHIFDRFYRVGAPSENASPEKGLGLGLSFVAWIVKAHGGSIDVMSEPGQGTRFIVLFPESGQPTPPGDEQNLIAAHS